MKKRKDNLTDFIENLTASEIIPDAQSTRNQVVQDPNGNLITLGLKIKSKGSSSSNNKYLELSMKEFREMVKSELEKQIDDVSSVIAKKVIKKLKSKGML